MIADAFAKTGDKAYAAYAAGVSKNSGAVSKALANPLVHAEVARREKDIIFNTVLPLAVKKHIQLLESSSTPAGAMANLIKLAYDQTLGSKEAGETKEAHEMTPEELAQGIASRRQEAEFLEAIAAGRARLVEGETIHDLVDDEGVFG